MGSENQIHKGITLFDLLNHGGLLHHAAAQGDLLMRRLLLKAV